LPIGENVFGFQASNWSSAGGLLILFVALMIKIALVHTIIFIVVYKVKFRLSCTVYSVVLRGPV
jgi:hypothetical protein